MTESREQNKRINQHKRLIDDLRERLRTVELDVEPIAYGDSPCEARRNAPAFGRISNGFDAMEEHLEELESRLNKRLDNHEKRFDRLEHKSNQVAAKLDIIIEHLTNINDLPSE